MSERRAMPYTFQQVREMLQARIGALLDDLGFQGGRRGPLITPLNPMRDDKRPGSFVIWLDGERIGAWKDYATGQQGSVIDLVMGIKRLAEPMDAYWWSLNWLGLENAPVAGATEHEQRRRREEADRLARAAKADGEAERKSRRLFAYWLSLGTFRGTVAETYLREARGIPLERIAEPLAALRFSPALDHVDEETGEVTSWPCMVSAMTRGPKLAAIHRTWLMPDGSGKAPVAKAKKMAGPVSGSAIRLTPGRARCSPGAAVKAGKSGPLAIGEGIETTLTVAAAKPDYRCWAAGSLSLMGLLDWPECASAVVLLKDNDWKPEAVKAFAAVEARWRELGRGRPVAVVGASVGNDFNDMARTIA